MNLLQNTNRVSQPPSLLLQNQLSEPDPPRQAQLEQRVMERDGKTQKSGPRRGRWLLCCGAWARPMEETGSHRGLTRGLNRGLTRRILNVLQHCFCFTFWFFDPKACGILAPWSRIEPSPHALEGEVLKHWAAREVPILHSYCRSWGPSPYCIVWFIA